MKNKVIIKALSITCSAALCCTGLLPAWTAVPAFADEAVSTVSAAETAQEKIVPVIITVKGDALLANGRQAKDLLDTDISAETAAIAEAQEAVQNALRALYPALSVTYSYNALLNGFACELPESLIDDAEAIDGVAAVSVSDTVILPKMAKAPAFSGFPAYCDKTGCTGEGQVIAVIDTELDVTHPMFSALADNIKKTVTKEQVAAVKEKLGLNVEISADDAYVNTKLPFAADYIDDPVTGLPDQDGYHGTHVAGIAAGNTFTDAQGNTFSGIAKDAQLLFMGVGTGGMAMSIEAAVAALEDAVKLGADVVNMSFGGEGENFSTASPLPSAIDTAEAAGVSIVMSAGNSDNGAEMYGQIHTPDNPDVSTMNLHLAKDTKAMAIASADNTLTVRTKTLVVGDKNIRFSGMIDTDMSPLFLDECFEQNETGEYEYVFCGGGDELDYMGIDAAGKIAVVNRGNHFNEILSSARAAGALGVLIINNTAESIEPLMKEGDFEEYAPVGMVSQEDGKLLLEAEKKVIRFRNDAESFASFEKPTDVSSYSSWGVQNSLVLRPDIMGIGGSVESAAYEGKASLMSGTSMSSPYVAGCVAVFNQYLEAQGCKLTSSERMKYIRNLLMTSAVPYQKDDMYVTPRRQGAGLISLDNALSDTVLLTGKEGETKINLFDQLGDTFTFEVTLTNIGKEDVTFENAKLCLTTDALQSDENMNIDIIEGQQKLTADAVLDGVKTVKAGETRTEKITVKLDAKQTAALKEKFIAGFFVEGYLLLGSAKNCCDISIPMLGFYGDWTAVSIFTGENSLMYGIGGATLSAGASLFRISEICNEIKARLTPEQLAEYEAALAPSSDLADLLAPTQNPISLLMEYATEEEMAALTPEDQTIFLSPNMDGIADMFGVQAGVQRNAMISGACVMDGSGKVLIEGSQSQPCGKATGGILLPSAADLSTLEDGEYYGGMFGYIDYGDAAEHPQFTESALVIDKTAPEMTGTIREENGKKILTLKVSDKYLDGIVLLGVSEKPDDAHAMERFTGIGDALRAVTTPMLAIGQMQTVSPALPQLGKMLLNCDSEAEYADYNYADVILPTPDENGTYSFDYDVTGLSSYSFTAADKAFNMSVFESPKEAVEKIEDGVYMSDRVIWEFRGNTWKFISFADKTVVEGTLEYKDGKMYLTNKNENGKEKTLDISLTKVNSKIIRMTTDILDGSTVQLTKLDAASIDEIEFMSVAEVEEELSKQFAALTDSGMFGFGISLGGWEHIMLPNGLVNFKIQLNQNDKPLNTQEITVDLLSGTARINGLELPLLNETVGEIPAGNYVCIDMETGEQQFMVVDTEKAGGKFVSIADKSEIPFTYAPAEDAVSVVFTIGEETRTAQITETALGFTITFEDETSVMLVKFGEAGEPLIFYCDKELGELAEQYEKAVTGRTLPVTQVIRNDDGSVQITLDNGTDSAVYTVNAENLQGKDSFGLVTDLLHAPAMPKNGKELSRLAEMSKKDYEVKHGTAPAKAVARLCEEGIVYVFLTDAKGKVLDSYTVDAVTAKGLDAKNGAVDLPQTGANDPAKALAVAGALSMLTAGAYIMRKAMRKA